MGACVCCEKAQYIFYLFSGFVAQIRKEKSINKWAEKANNSGRLLALVFSFFFVLLFSGFS